MKEFEWMRGGNFIKDKGFDGLQGLVAVAKEKGVGVFELLKEAEAQEARGNKKK